jgi:uncharacterized protein YkwD
MNNHSLKHLVKLGTCCMASVIFVSCGGGSGDTNNNSPGNSSSAPTDSSLVTAKAVCPAAKEPQIALAILNAARAEARQCGATLYPAAAPLIWDTQLEAAAQQHADDMANRDFFSHTNPNGVTASQRTAAAGYGAQTGENISAGYASLESAMQGWLSSPGHCANIMSTSYKHYAVACSVNKSSSYGTYWTQTFGSK